jgi:cytochrome c
MNRHDFVRVAVVLCFGALICGPASAQQSQYATQTKAIEMFNKGDGGFRDRDLYVFCFDAKTGIFNAQVVKSLLGTDIRLVKEKDGSPLGQKIFDAVKEGSVSTVQYNFPRPGSNVPVAKESYVTAVGNQACGVGYYK